MMNFSGILYFAVLLTLVNHYASAQIVNYKVLTCYNNCTTYNAFFNVNDKHRDAEVKFQIQMAILGNSRTYLFLTTSNVLQAGAMSYEIELNGNNCALRKNVDVVRSVKTDRPLLSEFDYEAFVIKVYWDGIVEFGRENDENPLITFNDTHPFNITYFSFKTKIGRFLFDYVDYFNPTKGLGCKEDIVYKTDHSNSYHKMDSIHHHNNILFELHVSIIGDRDARIIMTESDRYSHGGPGYEIAIGTPDRETIEIRRQKSGDVKKRITATSSFLSPVEYRSFHATATRVGSSVVVELRREGDNNPIISYTDTSPLLIFNYIGFCTWVTPSVKFLFDCTKPFFDPAQGGVHLL